MKVSLLVLLVACGVWFDSVGSKTHVHSKKLEALIEKTRHEMQEFREVVRKNSETMKEELNLTSADEEELEANLQKLRRKTTDDSELTVDSIEEVNTALGIADELFEDDIILSREELHQIFTDFDESRQKRQAYRNDTYPALWTGGVFYTFDEALNKRAQTAFRKAASLWMSNTCINFTELGNDGVEEEEGEEEDEDEEEEQKEEGEAEDDGDNGDAYYYQYEYNTNLYEEEGEEDEGLIVVHDKLGCSSFLGKAPEGVQPLSLGRGCETIGAAAHEIGHALGFLHTHTRYDRNQFILVNKAYINEAHTSQFRRIKKKNNNNYNLPYDYGSVMHYKATTVTTEQGKLTIVPKDVLYTETLGSPMISFYDLLMMNLHYNCTARCGESTQCNGGFAHPRNCSKCICPSGYGGQFCNERPLGCGEVLNASANWTPLKNDPNNMTFGYQDGYKKCHFWIKAPNGTKIEVQIVDLPANVSDYGCKYAGVEIKTHKDQRLTGYRFCSRDDINITLTSNLTTVPVLTYMRRRRNHTDIVLRYRYVEDSANLQVD